MRFLTDNVLVAERIYKLLRQCFDQKPTLGIRRATAKSKGFIITVNGMEDCSVILNATGVMPPGQMFSPRIDPMLTRLDCCKKAYLRGAFLASGVISDPQKHYHMEFVHNSGDYCLTLQGLLNSFELGFKTIGRRTHFVVYVKEAGQIVDMLNILGAHILLMEFENLRIVKELKNEVNRIVNCENANIDKTARAAVRQLEDIELIDRYIGLSALPPQLEQLARARLGSPEMSLLELGESLEPQLGKSGVNHRLRKIKEIAEGIREQEGI